MNDFHEHVLRSWTAAEQYQRVLREWAATCWHRGDLPTSNVTEVKLTYREKPCRKCPASDAQIDVSVTWAEGCSVTTFDSVETTRSLVEALTRLVPIVEEHSL